LLAASYIEAHRYDGAVVQHDRRDAIVPCVVQPRDLAIVRDVWRYKFLTAPQLLELWWPDAGATWPGQRRLRKLFNAGYLERFRPIARRGSYPWTYHLWHAGHQLLQRAAMIPRSQRFYARAIYDFGHVLHELQLNAWVLAFRRAAGEALLAWHGETDIAPPRDVHRDQLPLPGDSSVEDLRDDRPRLLRPDAVLEVAREEEENVSTVLIEYDRTRRIDKNYEKFRRYDAFLCSWWRLTTYGANCSPPIVVFVCQTQDQCRQFLTAADHELTGHHWRPTADLDEQDYLGRRRLVFALEHDAHAGVLEAWQLPGLPPTYRARRSAVRRIPLAD
jgi:hypothetical protein